MENHFDLSNQEFERQFSNCKLNPSLFNHEAHLRLAWIHIDKYGLDKALENIQNQLQNFVAHVGEKDKYHITLTIASVYTVNHFIKKSKSNNFKDFITEFPQLKNNFKDLIGSHYSFDILKSLKAKEEYMNPDVLPFTD